MILLLVIGDVVFLYAGLFLTLLIRYGSGFYEEFIASHAVPFSIIFVLWLAVFYIAGLYDRRRLRNGLEFAKTLWLAIFVNALVSVAFFYLIPAFGISPKTNLLIFVAIFSAIEFFWRRAFNSLAASGEPFARVLLIGASPAAAELGRFLRENPQLGYALAGEISPEGRDADSLARETTALAKERRATLVVADRALKYHPAVASSLYHLLAQGTEVRDLPAFYESVFRRIPTEEIEEAWFLEHVAEQKRFYDPLKRGIEFALALALGLVLSPLEILIALAVKLSSRGPAIYSQTRVGERGREFTFYKFRTMPVNAERNGAQWAAPGDSRATPVGKILRHTHLDELPQLWNILRGDLSFVGPRPERPEFVKTLKEKIPYYEVRLLVKPGVTGWAQINHRADFNDSDVARKVSYDIYYVKNRSLLLDLAIVVKTLKTLFVTPS